MKRTLPYRYVAEDLEKGEIVPFLGAGASLTKGDSEATQSSEELPTGRELALRLAEIAEIPKEDLDVVDLTEVASCFEALASRPLLEEELERLFSRKRNPGAIHRFLAAVPAPLLIVTTNYDTLIEDAFREQGREFLVVMTQSENREGRRFDSYWWAPGASQPNTENDVYFDHRALPIIFKAHGGIDPTGRWQRSTITEADYFEVGGLFFDGVGLPLIFRDRITHYSLLFLGYSLRDMHFRYLISRAVRRFDEWHRPRHFLVSRRIRNLDRIVLNRVGVETFEMTIEEFLSELEAAGKEKPE